MPMLQAGQRRLALLAIACFCLFVFWPHAEMQTWPQSWTRKQTETPTQTPSPPPAPTQEPELEPQPEPTPFGGPQPEQPPRPFVDDVLNATLGFQKIFVISLPERTDHRDGLTLAASLTGLELEFIDAKRGDQLAAKARPPNFASRLSQSAQGSWRSHIDALSEAVRQNLASVLILEDDVDWDVRIKSILRNAALSTNAALQSRKQGPLATGSLGDAGMLMFEDAAKYPPPTQSPYGDGWDILWIGSCWATITDHGVQVLQYDDPTVAQHQHYRAFDKQRLSPLSSYPNHTRWVGTADAITCTQGYAVSLEGARKVLYETGIMNLDTEFDLMLSRFCVHPAGDTHLAAFERKCLTIIPSVFEQYRAAGKTNRDSDITNMVWRFGKTREAGFSENIRWSARANMERMLAGATDYIDQYPDE